jgi:hypothetical protein
LSCVIAFPLHGDKIYAKWSIAIFLIVYRKPYFLSVFSRAHAMPVAAWSCAWDVAVSWQAQLEASIPQ